MIDCEHQMALKDQKTALPRSSKLDDSVNSILAATREGFDVAILYK